MTVATESPGIVGGALCGARTREGVIQTKARFLQPAKCNRWEQHDGLHRMTRARDFGLLYEWGDDEVEITAKKGSK